MLQWTKIEILTFYESIKDWNWKSKYPAQLFPVQQPLLPLQFVDFGQVLADLQGAAIKAFYIPHRKVANVKKPAAQFDPEFGRVPWAGFERIRSFYDKKTPATIINTDPILYRISLDFISTVRASLAVSNNTVPKPKAAINPIPERIQW